MFHAGDEGPAESSVAKTRVVKTFLKLVYAASLVQNAEEAATSDTSASIEFAATSSEAAAVRGSTMPLGHPRDATIRTVEGHILFQFRGCTYAGYLGRDRHSGCGQILTAHSW